MKKRSTINDIAQQAGVSKRTVSRVINGAANVNSDTRKKIEHIIKQEGFSPDKKARGLAVRRSYLLGIIYDNPGTFYIDQVQEGVLDVITEKGYELIVHPCHYHQDNFVDNCLNFVKRSSVDGVIVLPPVSESSGLAENFRQRGINYVRMTSVKLDDPDKIVVSDDRTAVEELARYLAAQNHSDIAVISGPGAYSSSIERLEGFCQTLRDLNINIAKDWIVEGNNTYESGIECGRLLLQKVPRPATIFANNDEMAVGVIKAAHDLNIAIPEALSVVGFDDNLMASRMIPSLTTIRRPVAQMASIAAKKLIGQIEGLPIQNTQSESVIPRLILRESTSKK